MTNVKWTAALMACLTLLSCSFEKLAGGAGAGNPPQADVVVSLKASSAETSAPKAAALTKVFSTRLRNPDSTFTVADSVGNAWTLSAIEVRIQKIEFALPQGITCTDLHWQLCEKNEVIVKGPYNMNLMTGSATPAINFIKLPEGLYTRIALELPEFGDITSISDTVVSNLVIRGVGGRTASESKRFELKLNLSDGLEFTDSIGVRISASSLNKLTLSLLVDGWFRGTDMLACIDGSIPKGNVTGGVSADSAGVVQLLGDTACGNLGLRIRRNIEASSDVLIEELSELP